MAATEIAQQFPLIRGGGAFLVAIGIGIVAGAFGARVWRLVCLIAGAALGVAAMAVGGATEMIFDGLGSPEVYQWAALGAGILLEGYLVSVVVRRWPDLDSREFWMWMLFVVAVHFLVLGISHGPVSAALAVLCMINAQVGLHATTMDHRLFWAIDGTLKMAAGTAMLTLSY